MNFLHWLGRVIMLVLAGMVTLSIIGAIAAIPNGIVPQQLGLERQPPPAPEQTAERPPDQALPEADPGDRLEEAGGGEVARRVLAPVQPQPVDPARWLETISYAPRASSAPPS